MMQILDAIYEHGAFRPLEPADPGLADGQRVRITIESAASSGASAGDTEFDLDALLARPRAEQSAALHEAACAAAQEYALDVARPEGQRELTAITALDGEDFLHEPA
jgi:predicted DNA-binding antitoxin AbrB/MazE fold protein